MRKLLVAALLLGSLIVACETKTPLGPASVTPTTSTTTSSTPTTSPTSSTSTSTTTSIPVITSLVRNFKAFPPPPANLPSEMTLFYQLITPQPVARATAGETVDPPPENEYRITGVWIKPDGTTGTVVGELGGNVNPAELGGEFEGFLTAKTPAGCTAQRDFSGSLTPLNLEWTGGAPGTATCSPSPLSFASVIMLRSDANTPLPTPPPTSSSTSTTTTSVACTYTLSPPSPLQVGSAGGTQSVTITTPAGCGWSAQSFDSWITMNPPFGGTGTTTVSFNVASTTVARTGSLRIAGQNYTVMQAAPPPDLVVATSPAPACTRTGSGSAEVLRLTVTITNQGPGGAGPSTTRVDFERPVFGAPTVITPVDAATPSLASRASSTLTFDILSDDCFVDDRELQEVCSWTIRVDFNNNVTEPGGGESNNTMPGMCTRPLGGMDTALSSGSSPGNR